jgi:hypothetical protein
MSPNCILAEGANERRARGVTLQHFGAVRRNECPGRAPIRAKSKPDLAAFDRRRRPSES